MNLEANADMASDAMIKCKRCVFRPLYPVIIVFSSKHHPRSQDEHAIFKPTR